MLIIDNDNFVRISRVKIKINISDKRNSCIETNFRFIIIGRVAAVINILNLVDYLVHKSKNSNSSSVMIYCRFN